MALGPSLFDMMMMTFSGPRDDASRTDAMMMMTSLSRVKLRGPGPRDSDDIEASSEAHATFPACERAARGVRRDDLSVGHPGISSGCQPLESSCYLRQLREPAEQTQVLQGGVRPTEYARKDRRRRRRARRDGRRRGGAFRARHETRLRRECRRGSATATRELRRVLLPGSGTIFLEPYVQFKPSQFLRTALHELIPNPLAYFVVLFTETAVFGPRCAKRGMPRAVGRNCRSPSSPAWGSFSASSREYGSSRTWRS